MSAVGTRRLAAAIVVAALTGCTDSPTSPTTSHPDGAHVASSYDAVIITAPIQGTTLRQPGFLGEDGEVVSTFSEPDLGPAGLGAMWWRGGIVQTFDAAAVTGITSDGAAIGLGLTNLSLPGRNGIFTLGGGGAQLIALPATVHAQSVREAGGTIYAMLDGVIKVRTATDWSPIAAMAGPWLGAVIGGANPDGAILIRIFGGSGAVVGVRVSGSRADTLVAPPGLTCETTALLHSGRVLGRCDNGGTGDLAFTAIVWDPPTYAPRPLDPANGIRDPAGGNNLGMVVGVGGTTPGALDIPVAWTPGQGAIDIRPRIQGAAGWMARSVEAVNDRGQMLVYAIKNASTVAYLLLTPRD